MLACMTKHDITQIQLTAVQARLLRELMGISEYHLADSAVFATPTVQQLLTHYSENEKSLSAFDYSTLHTAYKQTQQWRKTVPAGDGTGPKNILLAALRAAHADFLTSASSVPETEHTTLAVCGWWTLKDLLGHLADWDIFFLNCLNGDMGTVRGIPMMRDEDEFNAALQASRAHQPLAEITADFEHIRHTFLSKIDSLSQEELQRPSPGTVPYPTLYHDIWATVEHYLDHAAGLRRQLNMPLPKWLLTFTGPYA